MVLSPVSQWYCKNKLRVVLFAASFGPYGFIWEDV